MECGKEKGDEMAECGPPKSTLPLKKKKGGKRGQNELFHSSRNSPKSSRNAGFCFFKEKQLSVGKNNELWGILAFPCVIPTLQLWGVMNTSACPQTSGEPPEGRAEPGLIKPPSQRAAPFDVSSSCLDTSVHKAVCSGHAVGLTQ